MEHRDAFFSAYWSLASVFDFCARTVLLFAFWYVMMVLFIGTYHPLIHVTMTVGSAVFSSVGLSSGLLS